MPAFDSWENELYHFGILGMKWGVRRYQNPDGSYTNAGLRHRRVSRMTDEELKRGIERKKLEKDYREANRSPVIEAIGKAAHQYADYRNSREKAAADKEQRRIKEMELRTRQLEAKYGYLKARKESYKNKGEYLKARASLTIRGAFTKRLNSFFSRSKLERKTTREEQLIKKGKAYMERLNTDKSVQDLEKEMFGGTREEIESARSKRGRDHSAKRVGGRSGRRAFWSAGSKNF